MTIIPDLETAIVMTIPFLVTYFALQFGSGGLWRGFEPALAVTGQAPKAPYDLTRLDAVNETLRMIRDKYVDPDRVKPKEMLLSALNSVQYNVAQVIVLSDDPNGKLFGVGLAVAVLQLRSGRFDRLREGVR